MSTMPSPWVKREGNFHQATVDGYTVTGFLYIREVKHRAWLTTFVASDIDAAPFDGYREYWVWNGKLYDVPPPIDGTGDIEVEGAEKAAILKAVASWEEAWLNA